MGPMANSNPDVNEMTTTFIYAHLTTSPVGGNFPAITSLKGISSAMGSSTKGSHESLH